MGTTIDPNFSKYHVIDINDPIYQSLRNTDAKYKLNYLSIPITLKISVPLNKYSLYAKGGGYVSYLLYGKSYEKTKTYNYTRNLNFEEEQIKRLDLGIIFGMGVTRELGPGFLFLDARYMLGLSDLNNSSNIYSVPFGIQKVHNRGLFLNAGYMFRLGKAK